jgi:hypothetical protein
MVDIRIRKWLEAKKEAKIASERENSLFEKAQDVEIPNDDELRPATPADIKLGQIIWYKDGDEGSFWMDVDEVRNPQDLYKAFYSTEGSSYGLAGAFVMKIE